MQRCKVCHPTKGIFESIDFAFDPLGNEIQDRFCYVFANFRRHGIQRVTQNGQANFLIG